MIAEHYEVYFIKTKLFIAVSRLETFCFNLLS